MLLSFTTFYFSWMSNCLSFLLACFSRNLKLSLKFCSIFHMLVNIFSPKCLNILNNVWILLFVPPRLFHSRSSASVCFTINIFSVALLDSCYPGDFPIWIVCLLESGLSLSQFISFLFSGTRSLAESKISEVGDTFWIHEFLKMSGG